MLFTYILTFVLTVLTEEGVALFFLRDKCFFISVFLVNAITHTTFNFILLTFTNHFLMKVTLFEIVIFEIIIVFVEYYLLVYAGFPKLKMVIFSSLANTTSFLLGLYLIKIGLLPGVGIL